MVENGYKNFFLHKRWKNYPILIYNMNLKLANKKDK